MFVVYCKSWQKYGKSIIVSVIDTLPIIGISIMKYRYEKNKPEDFSKIEDKLAEKAQKIIESKDPVKIKEVLQEIKKNIKNLQEAPDIFYKKASKPLNNLEKTSGKMLKEFSSYYIQKYQKIEKELEDLLKSLDKTLKQHQQEIVNLFVKILKEKKNPIKNINEYTKKSLEGKSFKEGQELIKKYNEIGIRISKKLARKYKIKQKIPKKVHHVSNLDLNDKTIKYLFRILSLSYELNLCSFEDIYLLDSILIK